MRAKITGAAAFGLLLATLFPTAAWAPRVFTVPTSLCETTSGTQTLRGDFVGSFLLGRFAADGNALVAEGSLTGTCFGDASDTTVNSDVSVPVRIIDATCEGFSVALTSARLDGVSVDLSGQSVHFLATKQNRKTLCRVSELARSGLNTNALAGLLTSLLGRS